MGQIFGFDEQTLLITGIALAAIYLICFRPVERSDLHKKIAIAATSAVLLWAVGILGAIGRIFASAAEAIGESLSAIARATIDFLASLVGGLYAIVQDMAKILVYVVVAAWEFLSAVLGAIAQILVSAAKAIGEFIFAVAEAIINLFIALGETVFQAASDLGPVMIVLLIIMLAFTIMSRHRQDILVSILGAEVLAKINASLGSIWIAMSTIAGIKIAYPGIDLSDPITFQMPEYLVIIITGILGWAVKLMLQAAINALKCRLGTKQEPTQAG